MSERAPETEPGLIDSRVIHDGRIVHLSLDRVRFPDGSEGDLELIRHPGASAIVPFLDPPGSEDPRVLLVHQYRYATGGMIYEVPAGVLEPNERPEACARRELEEETGWCAGTLRHLTTIYTTPGFTDERIHLFAAWGLTEGHQKHDADEFLSVEAFRFSRVRSMIEAGEIVDGKSLSALLWVDRFLLGVAPEDGVHKQG